MLLVQLRFGLTANLAFTLPAFVISSPLLLRRLGSGLPEADIVVSLSQAEKLQRRTRGQGPGSLTVLVFVFAVLTLIGVHLLARGQVMLGALGIVIFGAAMALFAVQLLRQSRDRR